MIALFLALSTATIAMPDPKLTPGAINPNMTAKEICAPEFRTGNVRPPTSYTNALKRKQMLERKIPGDMASYEEDHAIPLCLGGDPRSELNLYPEIWPEARQKDVVEVFLNHCVCRQGMSLQLAQKLVWPDWQKIYKFHKENPKQCP